ncbi:DNA polymerase III subunit beta [Streptomyces sp. CC228A]|uniref:DNA polymerase III subunit beta n=1 Tax=Streptomyces sp. CC228A TaxID=2898186 RepID=UPI001F47BE39|nr:DNA polymerase III subunit beta [Streptomyces sp. CC228A]
MELRIEQHALTEAVAWAARVLPTRSPVPLLGGLLLEAEGDRLRVSGLDHEASARVETEAETIRPGRALVMGRRLLDVCRVLPEGPVTAAVDSPSRLTLGAGGARFGLSLLPLQDHPAPPGVPEVRGEVDAPAFAAAVAQVAAAAGRDETLPALTGLRLALTSGTLTLAATDRYRYALRTIPWKPTGAGLPSAAAPETEAPATETAETGVSAAEAVETAAHAVEALVPARRLAELTRALATEPGTLTVALDDGTLALATSTRRATTRLLEGRLPRHDKLFALDDTPATATLDRAPLTEAVKRVAVVADRDSPIHLTFTGDTVHLQAGHEDDVASQHVPAHLDGEAPLTVAFNPAYLLEALTTFEASTLHLHLQGPGQRALLTAGPTHQHLLMSMRTPGV